MVIRVTLVRASHRDALDAKDRPQLTAQPALQATSSTLAIRAPNAHPYSQTAHNATPPPAPSANWVSITMPPTLCANPVQQDV